MGLVSTRIHSLSRGHLSEMWSSVVWGKEKNHDLSGELQLV